MMSDQLLLLSLQETGLASRRRKLCTLVLAAQVRVLSGSRCLYSLMRAYSMPGRVHNAFCVLASAVALTPPGGKHYIHPDVTHGYSKAQRW